MSLNAHPFAEFPNDISSTKDKVPKTKKQAISIGKRKCH